MTQHQLDRFDFVEELGEENALDRPRKQRRPVGSASRSAWKSTAPVRLVVSMAAAGQEPTPPADSRVA